MTKPAPTVLTVVCLVLLVVFGRLSLKSGDSQFAEIQVALHEIEQINHEIDAAVLSLQMGFANDYDLVTASQNQLSTTFEVARPLFVESPTQLATLIDEKTRVVSDFKANHSVVRNSIAGFQRAIEEATPEIPAELSGLSEQMRTLHVAGMRYSMTGNRFDRQKLESALQELPSATAFQLSNDLNRLIQLTRMHGDNLLDRRTKLNDTIAALVDIPLVGANRKLMAEATRDYLVESDRINRYRTTFIAILVLLAAIRFYQYNLMIHQRRIAMESNALLERSVEQRTLELKEANRRREWAMAEAEKLALVARHTDNGVMITDRVGRIEWVNHGFQKITGYTLSDVAGKHTWEFLHGEKTDPEATRRLQEALRNGDGFDGEMIKYRKNGEPFWMAIEFRPIDDGDQEVARYIAIERDISERVAAELERQRLNEQLVDASRNAGIAENAIGVLHNVGNVLNSVNVSASQISRILEMSAFSRLEKIANLLREHLDDFSTFVSNDSRGKRTPEFIVKLSEVLKDEFLTIRAECSDLVANVEHIKEIIVAQQASAKSAGLVQEFCPKRVVENAIVANKGKLAECEIDVRARFADNVQPISSDKHKVLQILINLISNAKDAIVESQEVEDRRIEIDVEVRDQQLRFSVADNGIGIKPTDMERIFQHGFTTKPNGHGFGLHSSANAATELGGTLKVQSDGLGFGTVFSLTLPLVLDSEAELELAHA